MWCVCRVCVVCLGLCRVCVPCVYVSCVCVCVWCMCVSCVCVVCVCRVCVCVVCECCLLVVMVICLPPRDTSSHQDSASTATSGTQSPAQPPPPPQTRQTQSHSALLGVYTILPLPILSGVWHTNGRSRGGRILPKRRAIVLQQCEQCRPAGRIKDRLFRVQTTRSKRISCKG